jgi:hypothetical protein
MATKRKLLLAGLIAVLPWGLFSCEERQKAATEKQQPVSSAIPLDKFTDTINWYVLEEALGVRQFKEKRKQIDNRYSVCSIYPDYFTDAVHKFVLETEDETKSSILSILWMPLMRLFLR